MRVYTSTTDFDSTMYARATSLVLGLQARVVAAVRDGGQGTTLVVVALCTAQRCLASYEGVAVWSYSHRHDPHR